MWKRSYPQREGCMSVIDCGRGVALCSEKDRISEPYHRAVAAQITMLWGRVVRHVSRNSDLPRFVDVSILNSDTEGVRGSDTRVDLVARAEAARRKERQYKAIQSF